MHLKQNQFKILNENEIATIIVNLCLQIHRELGPGLLESVYEGVLCYELQAQGISFERQKTVPVVWKGVKLDYGFRLDVLVENKVLVEIKSVEAMNPVYAKIVLTYLKLTGKKLGLLVNFNELLIKNGIRRLVNGL